MTLLIVGFIALALVIVVSGSFLAQFTDQIADLTGMGRTLAGLLLLAAATSFPELMVSCSAGFLDAGDLAAGNLFGSSLYNLAILGVLDLSFRSRGRMLSRMAGAHALSAQMSMVLTAVAMIFILIFNLGEFSWSLRIGPGSVTVVVIYILLLRLVYFDALFAVGAIDKSQAPQAANPSNPGALRRSIVGYVAMTLLIMPTAIGLSYTADQLAIETGLGGTFIGTAFLALTTSLPELVTTTAAVRMGAFDMAVGNIFGSNSFNMTILLGIDVFFAEPLLQSVSMTHAVTAASVIIVTAVASMGLLYRQEKRYWMVEPDAALVLLLVAAALALNYALS